MEEIIFLGEKRFLLPSRVTNFNQEFVPKVNYIDDGDDDGDDDDDDRSTQTRFYNECFDTTTSGRGVKEREGLREGCERGRGSL